MSKSSDYMDAMKRKGRLVFGTPRVQEVASRGSKWRKTKYLIIPYGARLIGKKYKPPAFKYLGAMRLYNVSKRRILSDFWLYLSYI